MFLDEPEPPVALALGKDEEAPMAVRKNLLAEKRSIEYIRPRLQMQSHGGASETAGRITLHAVDPKTGQPAEVLISHHRMYTVGRRSLGHAKECAFLVPHTLQHPTAVFEGLRKDEDEDQRTPGWHCYCSKPPYSFSEDGEERPPYDKQVFLVFVNQDKVAYNWRWAKADELDDSLPENHEERFTRRAL